MVGDIWRTHAFRRINDCDCSTRSRDAHRAVEVGTDLNHDQRVLCLDIEGVIITTRKRDANCTIRRSRPHTVGCAFDRNGAIRRSSVDASGVSTDIDRAVFGRNTQRTRRTTHNERSVSTFQRTVTGCRDANGELHRITRHPLSRKHRLHDNRAIRRAFRVELYNLFAALHVLRVLAVDGELRVNTRLLVLRIRDDLDGPALDFCHQLLTCGLVASFRRRARDLCVALHQGRRHVVAGARNLRSNRKQSRGAHQNEGDFEDVANGCVHEADS